MCKANLWYVLARRDKRKKYGFTQVTPRGKYYMSLPQALDARNEIDKSYVILKRSCQPLEV
jgi:hypothetical protein